MQEGSHENSWVCSATRGRAARPLVRKVPVRTGIGRPERVYKELGCWLENRIHAPQRPCFHTSVPPPSVPVYFPSQRLITLGE